MIGQVLSWYHTLVIQSEANSNNSNFSLGSLRSLHCQNQWTCYISETVATNFFLLPLHFILLNLVFIDKWNKYKFCLKFIGAASLNLTFIKICIWWIFYVWSLGRACLDCVQEDFKGFILYMICIYCSCFSFHCLPLCISYTF